MHKVIDNMTSISVPKCTLTESKSACNSNKHVILKSISTPVVPIKKSRKNRNAATDSVDWTLPLHEQQFVLDEISKFHASMNYVIRQCTICYEAWPIKTGSKKPSGCLVCPRCKLDKKNPKKFSNQNNMVPSAVPNELKYLTQFEEMLVSRAFVVMQVYVKPGLGYCIYYIQ